MFQVLSREEWYGAIYMAQAWHRQRKQLETSQGTEAKLWRASEYEVDAAVNPAVIKTGPNARWQRFAPFDSYRPASRAREVRAGSHLTFLRLQGVSEQQPNLFHKALILFANQYGLLGALEEDYELQRPVYPWEKMLTAPEAVIDDHGRLRRIDPATEGRELLLDLLEPRGWFHFYKAKGFPRKRNYDSIAMPSEVKFNAKYPDRDSEWYPIEPRTLVPWEEIRKDFGALLVLDAHAWKGVSILSTREPLRRWEIPLLFFPSGDTPVEDLVGGEGNSFNSYLQEVSPRAVIGEDGNLERGWRYRNLLQAMYVMLYSDLTGGHTIKKCQSRGCLNHFRLGPQAKSKYCSQRCANRASTRMRRGQEP